MAVVVVLWVAVGMGGLAFSLLAAPARGRFRRLI